jgi:anti-sigma factor RsiW
MTSCAEIDRLVTSYVDGEARPHDITVVTAHLAVCPACREKAEAERMVRDLLGARRAALVASAPAPLAHRCRQTGRLAERRSVWLPAAIAAGFALLAAGAGFVALASRSTVAFAAQLAADHQKCFRVTSFPPGVSGAVEARQAFATEPGWQIEIPPGSTARQIEFLGGRRCRTREGAVAHLMYELAGRPVSLFVLPGARHTDLGSEIMGHEAVVWTYQGTTYGLVGRVSKDELQPMAAYVRRFVEQ